MNTTLIKDISEKAGESVLLKGWCYNFRSSGSIYFLQLRDGSGRVQCVFSKKEVSDETWEALQRIAIEASVEVEGLVKP
jgi:asparaginyl-tRNA synthetase